ncbi:prepilin-type N-terminal cleavage/methylation domain-containing protein [Candidatus Saccharibacteria bacterium]|nr:prepilin-type N-terminal cleavage/methylation domain-containing protein [Candidatus Saccharibacteria bacterium]MCB9821053.1 prepilin-type N-terminal cleavage/methylation domain-containing protein [Candidatus Nomurabacteria bacterium]
MSIKENERGFSLVELLIVMPIIALITGTLFMYMFAQYGHMINETTEANLRLEAQTMLLNLEDELLFTTEYGSTTIGGSLALTDPYAPSGGWKNNTSPNTLIIYETALDSDRRDPNRDFIYKNQYGCSSGYNQIAINNLVYFTKNNSNNNYKTLYKRTLTPQYSICGVNFKVQTCPNQYVGTGPCVAPDAELTNKLIDFQVAYFDENNNATTVPGSAEKVELTVTLGDDSFGEEIRVTSKFIMKKIN